MGQTIVLTGMVLAAIPIGDYDKRITILTRERGKISAFARGARRQGSQLTAAANPFAFGEEELIWFDSSRGGRLCQGCKSSGAIPVDASTRYALQYIITSGIEKLYTFTVSGEVLSRLEWIMRDYMGRYIDRSFQSLQVLEENLDFLAR